MLSLLSGAVAFGLSTDQWQSTSWARSLSSHARAVVVGTGFGLDQVGVSGATMTGTSAVLDRMEMDQVRTLLLFDLKAAANRIEQLPWVKTAEITRRYPGQLHVKVHEREAFALWQTDKALKLVDIDGRVLAVTNTRMAPKLPVVSGRGAPETAAELMRVLVGYPTVTEQLRAAERVLDRRWRLSLVNGSQIELPSQGAARALATIARMPGLRRLLSEPNTSIDLRVNGIVSVRQPGARTATTFPVSGGRRVHRGG
ncbi:MAG: FtsQ-type POTRA domain-containing protein [Pseudomonadota bacterium]